MPEQATILIVEADLLARHPLAQYLRECGYRVLEASDAEEAKTLLGHEAVPVDIMLVEGEGGFALAGWTRANQPQVQVILAGSVARAAEKAGDLCEDGPNVELPYDHKFVLDRIRQLMAGRARRRPK